MAAPGAIAHSTLARAHPAPGPSPRRGEIYCGRRVNGRAGMRPWRESRFPGAGPLGAGFTGKFAPASASMGEGRQCAGPEDPVYGGGRRGCSRERLAGGCRGKRGEGRCARRLGVEDARMNVPQWVDEELMAGGCARGCLRLWLGGVACTCLKLRRK